MASKTKQTRQGQKSYWETQLKQRLSVLAEKGTEPEKIAKDPGIRKMRARIRQAQGSLRAIADLEKKVEEVSKIKAEKTAAPKTEKGSKEKEQAKEPELSKRQQKKMKKIEGKDKE